MRRECGECWKVCRSIIVVLLLDGRLRLIPTSGCCCCVDEEEAGSSVVDAEINDSFTAAAASAVGS